MLFNQTRRMDTRKKRGSVDSVFWDKQAGDIWLGSEGEKALTE